VGFLGDVLFRGSAVLFLQGSIVFTMKSKWKWKCPRRTVVIDKTVLLGHFLNFWLVSIKTDNKLSALGEAPGWGSGGSHLPTGTAGAPPPYPAIN